MGKNITRAYKGGSFGNLSRFKPQDLSAAKARLVQCYGKKVPLSLLNQWATEWWDKLHGGAQTNTASGEEAEVTLTELKSASSLDKFLSQICLSQTDVTLLVNLLEELGGATRALKVLSSLRELRGVPKDDQEKNYAERSES